VLGTSARATATPDRPLSACWSKRRTRAVTGIIRLWHRPRSDLIAQVALSGLLPLPLLQSPRSARCSFCKPAALSLTRRFLFLFRSHPRQARPPRSLPLPCRPPLRRLKRRPLLHRPRRQARPRSAHICSCRRLGAGRVRWGSHPRPARAHVQECDRRRLTQARSAFDSGPCSTRREGG
jgi:hypothetical protein